MSEKYGNIGRFLAVKQAFNRHLMNAVREIMPATKNLEEFVLRPEKYRLMQADDRMVDKVEDLLSAYQKAENGGHAGLNAPLPVVVVAYAKDSTVSEVTLGRGVYEPHQVAFEADGKKYFYKMKTTHMENRVQVCFIGHDSETVRAMTSQMRLYFQGYLKRIFPICWQWNGFDFQLSGNISDVDFIDSVVDVDERTNLSIVVWDFSIRFQMPYIIAPKDAVLDDSGRLKGDEVIKDIVIGIDVAKGKAEAGKVRMNTGYIDSDTQQHLPYGKWAINQANIPDLTEDDLKNIQDAGNKDTSSNGG